MSERTELKRTHRDQFLRAAEDVFADCERKEREFRQADRDERAAKLKLPLHVSSQTIHSRSGH